MSYRMPATVKSRVMKMMSSGMRVFFIQKCQLSSAPIRNSIPSSGATYWRYIRPFMISGSVDTTSTWTTASPLAPEKITRGRVSGFSGGASGVELGTGGGGSGFVTLVQAWEHAADANAR